MNLRILALSIGLAANVVAFAVIVSYAPGSRVWWALWPLFAGIMLLISQGNAAAPELLTRPKPRSRLDVREEE